MAFSTDELACRDQFREDNRLEIVFSVTPRKKGGKRWLSCQIWFDPGTANRPPTWISTIESKTSYPPTLVGALQDWMYLMTNRYGNLDIDLVGKQAVSCGVPEPAVAEAIKTRRWF